MAQSTGQIAAGNTLDLVWILLTAALVMMMQMGFLLLEAGMVRSKNSINVAQKNLLDFVFGVVAFAATGFMIAFGTSSLFHVGWDEKFLFLSHLDTWEMGFFVFQVMFCGTAATIVSGAVAERMKLSSYVAGSFILSGLIYPVFVHWAWGAALAPNATAYLANAGFVDFAGSTVVHATGGWISLAACMVIGPRAGRFDAAGKPVRINGHSPVLSTTGALLLFFGWIGFNGGSTLRASSDIALIVLNTVLAGGVGCSVGYLVGLKTDGVILPEKPYSGMLGGLVAVTAGCHILTPMGAMATGAIGSVVAIYGIDFVERVMKVDDAVGAIGVHAFGGVSGTLMLAFLAPVANLPLGSRMDQFLVQLGGSAANFVWAFSLGFGFFWLLNKLQKIRVSAEDEDIGLNIAEHATRLGVGHVETALADLVSGQSDLRKRLPEEAGGDAEKLTGLFNSLMDNLEAQEQERAAVAQIKRDREEEERVAALANATFEAIVVHREGIVIDANEQFARLCGIEMKNILRRPVTSFVPADEVDKVLAALQAGGDTTMETFVIHKSGEVIPVEVRGREIAYRNLPARVICIVDIRERKLAEQRIRHMAQHDPLTGLPNRALFNESLQSHTEIAMRGLQTALVLVDIDHFKQINDIHGHQAGDEVIREAALRLARVAGPRAFVARLGGDEFAIVLANTIFESQLVDVGRRLVDAFREPVALPGGDRLRCSISIGMARCPEHAGSVDELFALADIALYESKSAGRNCWTIFQPGMNDLLEKRRELEGHLAVAIEKEQFVLYLQPRIDVINGQISSYEALIRWNSANGDVIGPGEFIPVAEASGQIVPIGLWVVREACRMLSEGLDGRSLSINVSPLQFRHPAFVEGMIEIVEEAGIDPRGLELEITESVLIEDDQRALTILRLLKEKGFLLALDDFGTGYSSLSYLSRFPFDTIKIDRSFVRNLGESDSSGLIVKTIVDLGVGLGMDVIAEGVETIEEMQFLVSAGCDQLQGFLLGRPEPEAKRKLMLDESISHAIVAASNESGASKLRVLARQLRRERKHPLAMSA